MVKRKSVFIGAYVPKELKATLRRRATGNNRTLSQEITVILTDVVHGSGSPPRGIERRRSKSIPRRRAGDPFPRRRREDQVFDN